MADVDKLNSAAKTFLAAACVCVSVCVSVAGTSERSIGGR